MERRFSCTVCGKCCQGWLPLSIKDALSFAHLFPLGVLWSTVRQGARSFGLAQRLGVQLDRKTALRMTPLAYIPPSMACPALGKDMRCAIHEQKPLRCRAMPFSADREENDQDDLLIPRSGWLCDVSGDAETVYRGGRILSREDFDGERLALEADATILKNYGEFLLKSAPAFKGELERLAKRPAGGQMVLKISSLLRKVPGCDLPGVAARQATVLRDFLSQIEADPALTAYRNNYSDWLAEMQILTLGSGESA